MSGPSGKHSNCGYCGAKITALRFCNAGCQQMHAEERRAPPLAIGECPVCATAFATIRSPGGTGCCSARCYEERKAQSARQRYDPAKERAKRDKRMRAINLKHTDITAAHIAKLYRQTKACPLCDVRLTATPTQPNSREVDHIIPINVGGTHTIGNVRVICRACNLARPADGSDIADHQPTLWATDLEAAACAARGLRAA